MTQRVEFFRQEGFYRVEINGSYAGRVRRVEDWTVRGTRVRWEALTRRGVFLGDGPTRKQAVQWLAVRQAAATATP
jgi:hypothetical protein